MRRQLRDVADVHYGKSPSGVLGEDGTVPVIGTGGVYARTVRPLFFGPAVVVPRKGSLGNPQYVAGPFWPADTTYAVLPKRRVDARWLYYSLDRFDLTKLNEATGVPSISRDWLYKVPLSGVDFEQQRRIAEILSTLDEAIEQTEALIAKTQHIKAGLMHDLFARGVTPDGQLRLPRDEAPQLYKESPLGWIPKEWEVVLLGQVVPRAVYGISEALDGGPGLPVLRMNNLRNGTVDLTELKFSRGPAARTFLLRPGDVLFNRTNSIDHVGRTGIWRGELSEASFASYVVRLDVDPSRLQSDFLNLWLNWEATQIRIRRFATPGVHQVNINPTNLRRTEIAKPLALSEQDAIVLAVAAMEEQLKHNGNQMRKLREIKYGLMHDLLSGGIRVPEDNQLADAAP